MSLNEISDNEIISKVIQGNLENYAELVRRHEPNLRRLCLSLLHNETETEDALQDVFIKAYNALPTFRKDSSFSTWIYRITYRQCLDYLRKRKRDKSESWDAMLDAHGETLHNLFSSPHTPELSAANKDLVNRLLSTLPEDYRTTLILREVSGFSYQEIGEITHCSLDSVKARLKRARHELLQKMQGLERHLGSPESV